MKKFTFKTVKPTGKWKSLSQSTHYIKVDKMVLGTIDGEHPHRIRLQVVKEDINEDGNSNCTWKWVVLKQTSQTLAEAKAFLNNNVEGILKFNLYLQNYEN